jgi:deoxyribodipyrimidine photo-lyase
MAVVLWFRNDLRLNDNPLFSTASDLGKPIIPIYSFDPRFTTASTPYNTVKSGLQKQQF